MTYILSNLDFEYTWARGAGQVPKVVFEVARRWEAVLRLVEPGGEIWRPESEEAPAKDGARLCCWGWTPPVVEAARSQGLRIEAPPLSVVQAVNSKVFSHRLEQETKEDEFAASLVKSVDGFRKAACGLGGPWVLKHPWGVSGRLQRRGEGAPTVDDERWLERVLAEGEPAILEPRLELEQECSFHFDLTATGEVADVGWCRLLAGREGTLRGLVVDGGTPEPALLRGATAAAVAVAQAGYFGPLGIDAMVGRWRGERVLRPVSEINARWTFGRLALLLRERLAGAQRLTWIHPARSEGPENEPAPWPAAWQAGCFRLPDDVDPGARSGTYVELSDGG